MNPQFTTVNPDLLIQPLSLIRRRQRRGERPGVNFCRQSSSVDIVYVDNIHSDSQPTLINVSVEIA